VQKVLDAKLAAVKAVPGKPPAGAPSRARAVDRPDGPTRRLPASTKQKADVTPGCWCPLTVAILPGSYNLHPHTHAHSHTLPHTLTHPHTLSPPAPNAHTHLTSPRDTSHHLYSCTVPWGHLPYLYSCTRVTSRHLYSRTHQLRTAHIGSYTHRHPAWPRPNSLDRNRARAQGTCCRHSFSRFFQVLSLRGDVLCTAGVTSVQRVVCGGCHDFKVITCLDVDSFGAWEAAGFAPEADFLQEAGAYTRPPFS